MHVKSQQSCQRNHIKETQKKEHLPGQEKDKANIKRTETINRGEKYEKWEVIQSKEISDKSKIINNFSKYKWTQL